MKDYYVVLGVPRNETPRGIREAYRQLAKRYHPERVGPEASTTFRDVVEAYEALSDQERRSRLDRGLRRVEGRLDVAPDTIVFGEIALSGDVRPVGHTEARLKEAAKLGFAQAWVPSRRGKRREAAVATGLEMATIGHLSELVDRLAPKRAPRGQPPDRRRIGVVP